MKYEYTLNKQEYGKRKIKEGLIIVVFTLLLYLGLYFYHPNFSKRHTIVVFFVFITFIVLGFYLYYQGYRHVKSSNGEWVFKLDDCGLYYEDIDKNNVNVRMSDISSYEKVSFFEGTNVYGVYISEKYFVSFVENELENYLDFKLIEKVFKHYGKKVNFSKYSDEIDYIHELGNRNIRSISLDQIE